MNNSNHPLKRLRYASSFLRKRMVHLNLQLLYACNFKCKICDFHHSPYKDLPYLTVVQAEVIAAKLKTLGPQIISLSGGEPMMHPDLERITACLAQHNFPVMISNGWFVTPDRARALFEAGMHEISISLDYADPRKHDRQRCMDGAFQRAVEGLKVLQQNRTAPHQRVHMISVVMDDNLKHIEPLIQLAKKIGVTYMVTLYSTNRGAKPKRTGNQELSRFLLNLRKKYPHFVSIPGYIASFTRSAAENAPFCYAGRNLFNIDCTGGVSRCVDTLDDCVGNILHEDIGTLMVKLRRKQKESTCRNCWTSCRGSIETLMYGKQRLYNLIESHQVTKSVPLVRGAGSIK